MFSVVIPLFNKAPHIAATLNSVLAQTMPPFEIIVVDDGSTDQSATIVEQFTDPRVKLVRQNNAGVSAARNAGAGLAKSEYIAFLDADDSWLPEHLETLCELIVQCPDARLFSTLYEIHLGNNVFEAKSAYADKFSGYVDDFFNRMAVGLSLVHSSTACVAKEAFAEVGGFPLHMKRGEDLVLWMKLAQHFGVAHKAVVTAIYNRDAVNRSTALRERSAPGSLLYLQDIVAERSRVRPSQASAALLFRQIAFYTAAGMRETGDVGGVIAIRRLASKMKMPGLAIRIALLTIIPRSFLTFARRFRHNNIRRHQAAHELTT